MKKVNEFYIVTYPGTRDMPYRKEFFQSIKAAR